MLQIVSVGIGGFFGAILRFLVGKGVGRYYTGAFPIATLLVNLVGCFLLGFLLTYTLKQEGFNPLLRVAISSGFLGALTTFSTFSYETLMLLEGEQTLLALGNIIVSLVLGLFMGWLGIYVAKLI